MKEANNDNDIWTRIGLAAARVLVKIDEQKQEQTGGEGDADRGDEQKRKAHSDYVAKRIRETAAFERRVSGNKN